MTIIEAISKIDNLKHNTFPHEDKVGWLNHLDSLVKEEILDTHENCGGEDFTGYTMDSDVETVLLVPAPYDEMYLRWLEARIDYCNGEIARYNNSITAFQNLYQAYGNSVNRTHMPKGVKRTYF